MSKRISERQRWVTVFRINQTGDGPSALVQYGKALAVVEAFAKVGRVVRIEPAEFSNTLILKARRS